MNYSNQLSGYGIPQGSSDIPRGYVMFPGLTPEQSENTMQFLQLVADTYGTPYHCLVTERHILKRDTYAKHWDPLLQKRVYTYRDGERMIQGQAGIDQSHPAIYDLASGDDLFRLHRHAYGQPKRDGTYVYQSRPSLLETVLSSTRSQSYLFYPVLVKKHPMMHCTLLDNGKKRWTPYSYTTADVRAGRCAWVDIDGHDIEPEYMQILNPVAIENLMEMLPGYCAETGVPVPAVVNSGRGIHLYWWFDQAVPLGEIKERDAFLVLLKNLNAWAAKLIERDSVCAKIWKTDGAVAAVFHQMNLPGCVHPKTGKTRYVVNQFGRDYELCSYEALLEASVRARSASQNPPAPATVTPADSGAPTGEEPQPVAVENHTEPAAVPFRDSGRKLGKLLQWAEGRSWKLPRCRHKFLFVCACVLYYGSTGIDYTREREQLHNINQNLQEPLDDAEVNDIIEKLERKKASGTDPYTSGYLYSYDRIATLLDMTAEERQVFLAAEYTGRHTGSGSSFNARFVETMAAIPWVPERESFQDYKNRCYALTRERLRDEYGDQDRNGARTRRRAAREGYTGRPGRYKKDYTEERAKCLELKAQGLTQRQIAEQTGFSKSKVNKLLNL